MEEYLNMISVPAIAAVVYWLITLIKVATKNNEKVLRFVPLMAAVLGLICGIICYFAIPDIIPTENIFVALIVGAASGLSATGVNQIIKQLSKGNDDEKEDK